MKGTNRSPFTHGIEIEQVRSVVPRGVSEHVMDNSVGALTNWEPEHGGIRETALGPYKNCKTILNRFYAGTRDEGHTWDWHPASGGPGETATGCGSHCHLNVEDIFDDSVTAWTIAHNTVVELFPFFAPYFCHNWEDGFRNGSNYSTSRTNIRRWANTTTRRFSTSSMRDHVTERQRPRRQYKAVTLNPPLGDKPMTLELRANDAHPAVALSGLKLLRRVTGRAIEGGWSPKLENHETTLQRCYKKIYDRAMDVGLLTAMKEPVEGGITFQDDRGIPGVDKREFDTMWEVLRAIQVAFPQTPNTWSCRVQNLIRHGRDDCGPHANTDALWNIDADDGEFYWDNGPVDHTNAADSKTTDEGKELYEAGADTARTDPASA